MKPKIIIVVGMAAALFAPACGRMPTTPNDNTWRFLPGRVESLRFAPFRDGRQCWVYLPPNYSTSARRYPVIYLNDGHLAFDAPDGMHVNRICEDLIRRGEISPLIVVAITVSSDRERFWDYTPWPSGSREGGGDAYLRAIRDTLKPEVDRRYRTLRDPANTAIVGMSLGAYVSAYAGFAYDSTFGMVAAFSPPYGWAGGQLYGYVQSRGRPPFLRRYYHDSGAPYDFDIESMDRILRDMGFKPGIDYMSITVWGADHSAEAVEHRFPAALRFLFPP